MKLLSYYLQIALPIGILIWLTQINSPNLFVANLLAYIFIYRPIVDYLRLSQLGLVKRKKDLLLVFFHYYQFKYFYELYFKVN